MAPEGHQARQGSPGEATGLSLSYFGIQSTWGVTKHMGGLRATDDLAALCAIREGKEVLEVGCGAGTTARWMARKFGCRLVGVDRAQGMIEWARRRARRDHLEGQVEFRQADATSLPFADDRFDAVICESVLAFVPDKRRAVAEFARVARPGAYVGLNEASWVVDPPPDDLVAYLRQVMAGAEFLTPEGWGRLLEAAGLIGIAANAHKVTPLQQWLNEVRSFGLQDAADLLHAWGQFFGLLFRSPEFRAYARGIVPSRKVVRDLFGYLGYGLYIGRKRAGTSSGS